MTGQHFHCDLLLMTYSEYYYKDTGTGEGDKKVTVADCLLKSFARPRQKNIYELNLDINKRQLRS